MFANSQSWLEASTSSALVKSFMTALGLALPIIFVILIGLVTWSIATHNWDWVRELWDGLCDWFGLIFAVVGSIFRLLPQLIILALTSLGGFWLAGQILSVWNIPWIAYASRVVIHGFSMNISLSTAFFSGLTVVLTFIGVVMAMLLIALVWLFSVSLAEEDAMFSQSPIRTLQNSWHRFIGWLKELGQKIKDFADDDDEAGKDELQVIKEYDQQHSKA